MTGEIVLVAGPPCAGKTTYIRDHAGPGDTVLDQDVLGPTGYQAALDDLLANPQPRRAWVIRCLPGPTRREAFARMIGATRTVLLLPELEVLLQRAGARPDPARHRAAVQAWLDRESADAGDARRPLTVQAWW